MDNSESGHQKEVLDINDMAELLGISTRQIEKLMTEGAFPIPRLRGLGRRNLWSRAALTRYLENSRN